MVNNIEIAVWKDDLNNLVNIQVQINKKVEIEKVDFHMFNRCMSELGLNNVAQLKDNFVAFCNWHIRQSQYVTFEEIEKVGSGT